MGNKAAKLDVRGLGPDGAHTNQSPGLPTSVGVGRDAGAAAVVPGRYDAVGLGPEGAHHNQSPQQTHPVGVNVGIPGTVTPPSGDIAYADRDTADLRAIGATSLAGVYDNTGITNNTQGRPIMQNGGGVNGLNNALAENATPATMAQRTAPGTAEGATAAHTGLQGVPGTGGNKIVQGAQGPSAVGAAY